MGRRAAFRVSALEHFTRLVDGRRACESRCRGCGASGRCLVACQGDGGWVRAWTPRVDVREHEHRLHIGRRRAKSYCGACGVDGRCLVTCPGDGPAVRLALGCGFFVVTDYPSKSPIALRAWLREARKRGIAGTVYDPKFLQEFESQDVRDP